VGLARPLEALDRVLPFLLEMLEPKVVFIAGSHAIVLQLFRAVGLETLARGLFVGLHRQELVWVVYA
jgi:hypothetical protein